MSSGIALVKDANQYMLGNYRPFPIVIEKGSGAILVDVDGKEYIDLVAGIAVASLGHANADVAAAIAKQSQKLIHSSNILLNQPEIELAKLLCEVSGLQRVFFCNSGAEANEAMLKLGRRAFLGQDPERYEIVCMSKAFHGRTLGTISATGQEKYRSGFGPLLPGFTIIPFGDIEALKKAVSKRTSAVILEPILGEGGVIVPPEGYLKQVRQLCDETGCLMLLDEVQTGIGRTGLMFACQHEGVTPDAMAIAKGLGAGLPIGAMLVSEKFANVLTFPSHGSTFGGNPVACAAASVVVKQVSSAEFLEKVRALETVLSRSLHALKEKYPHRIRDVRGKGLFYGVEFVDEPRDLKERALARGVIVNFCGDRVMRIAPPLVIRESDLLKALGIVDELLGEQ
jgi:acetylornithine/N-succinyldiaminopimelate aminotransferase